VIDYQRDLFISGDFDRVVLLFTSGISDYHRDLFLLWWLVTYQWRVFHSLEFGTQRPYQNYNNNNN